MKPLLVVFFSSLGAFFGAVMDANGYGWRTWQFYIGLALLCLVIWLTKRALDASPHGTPKSQNNQGSRK